MEDAGLSEIFRDLVLSMPTSIGRQDSGNPSPSGSCPTWVIVHPSFFHVMPDIFNWASSLAFSDGSPLTTGEDDEDKNGSSLTTGGDDEDKNGSPLTNCGDDEDKNGSPLTNGGDDEDSNGSPLRTGGDNERAIVTNTEFLSIAQYMNFKLLLLLHLGQAIRTVDPPGWDRCLMLGVCFFS